uniref:chitin synthase n=1 Tax=Poecilia latipinna TaxID=48699 RepID=A0A3B3UAA7_9TELE
CKAQQARSNQAQGVHRDSSHSLGSLVKCNTQHLHCLVSKWQIQILNSQLRYQCPSKASFIFQASFLLLITLSHEDTKTLQAEQKPVALLCIGCSLIAPAVLLLLKSIWKSCYKSSKLPRKSSVLFFEFLVSVGLAVLTIVAMPHLDIVTNVAILNGVAVLSAFLQAVTQCTVKKMNIFLLPSIMASVVMVVGYCLFVVLYILKDSADVKTAIWVGLAVGGSILVSFNWWENYFRVICVKRKSNVLKNLFEDLSKCQNMLHIMSSVLRIVVTACVLGAYVPLAKLDWDIVTSIPSRETRIVAIIIGVQLISSALCHWFALAACKMHAVRRCFILPLYLASLAVMVLFIVPVILDYQDHQLSLNTTEKINFTSYCAEAVNVRNQNLFVRRLYEGAFIEQSLLLNTRFNILSFCDDTPALIYLCATMWHETYEEMMNIMISIFRLDKYRPKTGPKFNDFTFEAHIYFDDAFENAKGNQDRHMNTYAKDLVQIITEVYGIFKNIDKSFFEVQQHIPHQSIIETPYGARLVVEMPHGNNIVVHFKDKQKIRNKKRWSQVMYLYYLLGWKLMTKYHIPEHVFGCVLCSPGCFSLFRAEALMDDNVMKKYSTRSTEPSQYIQYDQGEDRWLCTLLLKQGWRVEYNAASDAYTNAPESFKELYNQRKRWGPSTMANIVDLIGSTNLVSKNNPSMSKPFMVYQLFAMISAILAPATICLMVGGSLSFLLNIPAAGALVLAVIPPAIYLGLCFKLKADTQITIAAVLSVIYALIMMVVTMSIIASMVVEQTILTPSSIFIVAMSIIYVVTALLHPQELPLLAYGLLYIICIPSAYLLLTIYSMVNMNSVSWGTRETKPAAEAGTTGANIQQTKTQKGRLDEKRFWNEFIEKYLEPLQNDKEKQEKTKNELQDLRNKINFSFFFLNALWLVAAFVFQVFAVFQLKFDIVDLNLNKTGKQFQVEPMSLMFILGFALSVLLQFIGMLYHRIMTLIHYVAFLETEPKQQKSARKEVNIFVYYSN